MAQWLERKGSEHHLENRLNQQLAGSNRKSQHKLCFPIFHTRNVPKYSGERKKCRFYKKGYCESLNRRMFLIFTQYIDMELLFQNM